jgi:hypothetical protein
MGTISSSSYNTEHLEATRANAQPINHPKTCTLQLVADVRTASQSKPKDTPMPLTHHPNHETVHPAVDAQIDPPQFSTTTAFVSQKLFSPHSRSVVHVFVQLSVEVHSDVPPTLESQKQLELQPPSPRTLPLGALQTGGPGGGAEELLDAEEVVEEEMSEEVKEEMVEEEISEDDEIVAELETVDELDTSEDDELVEELVTTDELEMSEEDETVDELETVEVETSDELEATEDTIDELETTEEIVDELEESDEVEPAKELEEESEGVSEDELALLEIELLTADEDKDATLDDVAWLDVVEDVLELLLEPTLDSVEDDLEADEDDRTELCLVAERVLVLFTQDSDGKWCPELAAGPG